MKNNWKPLTVLACSLFVAACGGGGGGGSDVAAPAAAPSNPGGSPVTPVTPTTVVNGAVTKGPVSGSILELFELDEFGGPLGDAVATGVTTDDGRFSIVVPEGLGDLLVIARGGSFIDESDQETDIAQKRRIALTDTQSFISLLPAGETEVAVTPFTTAVVLRGRLLGGVDGTFAAKFATAKAAMSTQAGFDIFTTVPANPIAPAATATESQKQYALLLGGIANLVNNVAIQSGAAAPTYDLVVAVTFDLVDGQFDGQYFGQTEIPGSTATPVTLPQNLDFQAEVTRFRNNNFDNFTDTVIPSITVAGFANNTPTANAGVDITVPQSAVGQLDGSASSDPDSGLFFSWQQTAGTPVTLDDAGSATPSFTAPQKLIGNEALTFELTVLDPIGFASTDTVVVNVAGALPNDFYVVDDDEQGAGIGTDVDGGGRITLNDETNGTLLTDIGAIPFTYTLTAAELTLDFATPLPQDDFDEQIDTDGDGVIDGNFLVEEEVDQLIFTVVTDNPNGDKVDLRAIGNIVISPIVVDAEGNIDDAATEAGRGSVPGETFDITEPATVFDVAQSTPFVITPGDRRTLLFNSIQFIPTLRSDDELSNEIFMFTTATQGSTADSGVSFDYSVDVEGNLNLTFENGESAKYINLGSRPTGDVMATEYNLNEPFFAEDGTFISDVQLSFLENTSVPLPIERLDAAGIYSGSFQNGDVDNANINLRLNPDGTGSVTLTGSSTDFGLPFDAEIVRRSAFGVCWDVDVNGELVVDRIFSTGMSFPNSGSSETSPAFCSSLLEEQIDFQLRLTQFDVEGTTVKQFERRRTNTCLPTIDPRCDVTPELNQTNFLLRITTRAPLAETPPVAAFDNLQISEGATIVADILANDIARDLPIDPTSVELVKGPFLGTAAVDPVTGELTYTPDPGIEEDLIQYLVRDTAGNPSQIQSIQVIITPCAEINGQRGTFERFQGDCNYIGIGGPGDPVLNDLTFEPLPNGGVHRFSDSLVIGQDYSSDALLMGAGIAAGGDGPTLTISAGTVLAFQNPAALLSISRGSRLNALGLPDAPVILTSQADIDNQRNVANGEVSFLRYNENRQWGGVIIHGFGVTNTCAYTGTVAADDLSLSAECHTPTPSGLSHFGGNNNADNSGTIDYLQIKHSGGDLGSGELAGALALAAVGSGTSISNVQVYSTAGDGLQLAGGDVDLQNVISLYAVSASVSIDFGYSGSLSNALLIQDRFSGEQCIDTLGYDLDLLPDPSATEAVIAQGLNSRPLISNVTCVVSADEQSFSGMGINFESGAFPTVIDSIVIGPGPDSSVTNNFCVGLGDRTLQGAQEGDLSITSNIFACADSTSFTQLPDTTPLDSFLLSQGNQFALLNIGSFNPAPIVGSSSGNVLIEGAPLIYTPAQADLMVEGSPVVVTPTGSFIGAVQQGATDWTLDWTFGLHPGSQSQPLWYEAPIVVVPDFVRPGRGEVVSLDGSNSVANIGAVTFQWNQISGDEPIVFSDPTGATTTFTAPGATDNLTAPNRFFELELVVTDSAGLEGRQRISVFIPTAVPFDFYTYGESLIPVKFNLNVEGGARVTLNPDFTGEYLGPNGPVSLNWFDTPTELTLDLIGGQRSFPIEGFGDINGDLMEEEFTSTTRIDQMVFSLIAQEEFRSVFSLSQSGATEVFDITNNVALPDDPIVSEAVTASDQVIVDVFSGFGFFSNEGQIFSFPTNVSTEVATLTNPDVLTLDELTFNSDGTGFALRKNQSFTHTANQFGPGTVIDFADGEQGEYVTLPTMEDSGGVVGVRYTKFDGSVVGDVVLGLSDDDFFDFASQSPDGSGIYETNQRVELDDGSFVNTSLFYRLHPDGTGQLEIENVDPVTGLPSGFTVSFAGICWELTIDNKLIWNRTQAPDQIFAGSRIPSTSHCSLINTASPDNTLIQFRRENKLFRVGSMNRIFTVAASTNNQCPDPQMPIGCDPTVLELTSTFQRNFESTVTFNGNPPIAAADSFSALDTIPEMFAILSNDLMGDSMIDPTTVTIIVEPENGTVTVNPTSGEIEYVGFPGILGEDKFYYRVSDMNGNESTIGVVTVTVSSSGGA